MPSSLKAFSIPLFVIRVPTTPLTPRCIFDSNLFFAMTYKISSPSNSRPFESIIINLSPSPSRAMPKSAFLLKTSSFKKFMLVLPQSLLIFKPSGLSAIE